MGLLDKIKKKVQNKHPLIDEDFETKINYLNAVAFFIAIDDDISKNEQEKFDELILLLKCEDYKDDLNSFLLNPNTDEFENIFDSIKKNGYFWIFIIEIASIEKRIEHRKEEIEFFQIILDTEKYEFEDVLDVLSFSKNCFYNDYMFDTIARTVLSNKRLLNNKEQIINFYKLNQNIKDKLLVISDGISDSKIIALNYELDEIQRRINDLKVIQNTFRIKESKKKKPSTGFFDFYADYNIDTFGKKTDLESFNILDKELDILKEEAISITQKIDMTTK